METELLELREFKKSVEDSCKYNVVIQNMNKELDDVRDSLTKELNNYKSMAKEYEEIVNNIFDKLSDNVMSKIDDDFYNFGVTEFNLFDKMYEYTNVYNINSMILNKVKEKLIEHNNYCDEYNFYYLRNNPYEWVIIDNDVQHQDHMNLVCPEENIYLTECNCKRCVHFRGEDVMDEDY